MKIKFKVYGMTCMHCHKRVTEAIFKVAGVSSVEVKLEDESAIVEFDPAITDLETIKQAVVNAGYETGEECATVDEQQTCPLPIPDADEKVQKNIEPGKLEEITLKVSGMQCSACALNIERTLKKLEGVASASVNLAMARAYVSYDPAIVGLQSCKGQSEP